MGALIVVAALPSSAQAASVHSFYAQCSTTGSYGYVEVSTTQDNGPDNKWEVHLEIKDTLADSMHAQARLVTTDGADKVHYWAWHYNNSGSGTTVVVNTTAQDTAHGILNMGVEAARGTGSTLSNNCIDWIY